MPSSDGGGREGLWWIPVPIKADKLNLLAVLQMFPCDQKHVCESFFERNGTYKGKGFFFFTSWFWTFGFI